jgi:peptidylprolyl isomerase
MTRLAAIVRGTTLLAALGTLGLGIGACSSGNSSGSAQSSADRQVTASGAAGKEAVVHIPAQHASGDLVTKTLIAGHGPVLAATGSYLANFDIYVWHAKTHRLLFSSYAHGPQVVPVTIPGTLTGLRTAIAGQRVGARVLAVLPPKYGYGVAGNPQAGVVPGDTLVWVIDVLRGFTATASASGAHLSSGGGALPTVTAKPGVGPSITIPSSAPPAKLRVVTLVQGSGPAVKAGQVVVVRYTGVNWRTKQVFDSDWPSAARPVGLPTAFTLGGVIPGWNTGLVGVHVGSRVLLVVPPAEGYGKAGRPSAGIKGTDTLVFVVDVLAVD